MSAADLLNDVLVDIARTAAPVSPDPLTAVSKSVNGAASLMARATAAMDYQQARIADLQAENTRLRELVRTYRAALVERT